LHGLADVGEVRVGPSCAGCGRRNRADARFCTGCGRSLAPVCPACGRPSHGGERFCSQCGAPLDAKIAAAAAVPAPEGERKQVTVLFADVVASMDLAERLDPDELTEVMQGLFAICGEAVEAFGGTVDKFTGDGIMALFGAPVALEDHARRACHAALELVESAAEYGLSLRARGIELAVRVGLNSGEVVAGSVGAAFTAVGHTVGLAQRMESLAEPGTARVSEHTRALVGDEFALRDLGPTQVKGSSVPVRVFALDAAAGGSASAGRRRTGSARLVGRDEELAGLQAALRAAMDGRAQVVGLVGEAGAGKSRLCAELARCAAELGVTVRQTAGVSHARSAPLLPILGFLRSYFGVDGADPAAVVRAKVAAQLVGPDAALETDLGLLLDFMEVPDPARPAPQLGPEVRRRRVLELFRRTTARRSEQQTLLLILEDLHWFDPHSVAFLEAWLPSFAGTRTLVVANFRPEFRAPWMGHSYYRQCPLGALGDSAVLELLDELLGPDPSLTMLSAQLRARTGGNPFFVEESVRALAADGTLAGAPGAYRLTRPTAQVRVPATVQAVLADRIDRMSATDKAVLHAAAVIGRVFTDRVLGLVTDVDVDTRADALRALCSVELLQPAGTAGEYRFWHPLTQEVAYGSQLAASRRRLHARAAQALIALGPDRHDELAPQIAAHFEAAGEDMEAARWQLRAGARAMRGDYAEAQRRLRSVVDHLALVAESDEALTLGVQARALLLRVGAITGVDPAVVDQLLVEARRSAERLGDPALLSVVSIADGSRRLYSGDPARGGDSFQEALRHAERAHEPGLMAFAEVAPANCCVFTGPLPQGLRAVERALALCGEDPLTGAAEIGYSVHDTACALRAMLLVQSGELIEAHRASHTALAFFELRPMALWHSWALATLALLADLRGEWAHPDEPAKVLDLALALARDSGSTTAEVRALQAAGVAALLDGRPRAAAATLAEALAEARTRRSGLQEEASLLAHLARAHLANGVTAEARAAAAEAVAVARRQGAKVMECQAQWVLARVLRESARDEADVAAARAAVIAGEALAAETGAATYTPFLAEERARQDGGRAALAAAADDYEAVGATGHARRVRSDLTDAQDPGLNRISPV
jgi:class 3 adenylate cyclase